MSRIKDLYAIENDIEDLVPLNKPSLDTIVGAAVKQITAKSQDVYNELFENATFTYGEDDEGHPETYFENYLELCGNIAEMGVDHIMEDWQIDLTREEYDEATKKVQDIIADTYADYESEIIKECEEKSRDDWQDFVSRNESVTPK